MFGAAKSSYVLKQKIVHLVKSIDIIGVRYSCGCAQNTSKKTWNVIFYGTDEFSLITLKALNVSRLTSNSKIIDALEIVCIKSDCVIRRYAEKNNLTIHTWPHNLPSGLYDVGVVVSFGHLIPSESILACKFGIINAHPSLLPRWRGAAPLIHTILNGDSETGVTITEVSPNKFDVGKIIMQKKYKIPADCTSKQLREDLGEMASTMVLNTLEDLPNALKTSYPQPKEGIKYAKKIKPEQGCIMWEEESVLQIYRKYKAFDGLVKSLHIDKGVPFNSETCAWSNFYNLRYENVGPLIDFFHSKFDIYSFWKGVKVTILKILPPDESEDAQISKLIKQSLPGYCYYHRKRKNLYVKCKDGWCGITSLKIPIRGKISALDFYNGFISKVDASQSYFSVK